MESFLVDATLGKNLKFRDLAKRLAGAANAYSALFRLWSFAAVYRKDGNLSGIDPAEMMLTSTEWKALQEARKESSPHGFVDCAGEVSVIHDWNKTQAYLVGAEKRSKAARNAGLASAQARAEAEAHEWSIARAQAMAEQRGHDRAEVDAGAAAEASGKPFVLRSAPALRPKDSPFVGRDLAVERFLDEGFEWFYRIYPKHEGRILARKAWSNLHKHLLVVGVKQGINKAVRVKMAEHMNQKIESGEWRPDKENRRFIPDPAVYLNQRRWED